jgi:hypothetical protein
VIAFASGGSGTWIAGSTAEGTRSVDITLKSGQTVSATLGDGVFAGGASGCAEVDKINKIGGTAIS